MLPINYIVLFLFLIVHIENACLVLSTEQNSLKYAGAEPHAGIMIKKSLKNSLHTEAGEEILRGLKYVLYISFCQLFILSLQFLSPLCYVLSIQSVQKKFYDQIQVIFPRTSFLFPV